MIKIYLFHTIYSKFSLMKSMKTYFKHNNLIKFVACFCKSVADMEAENPASDNWQDN